VGDLGGAATARAKLGQLRLAGPDIEAVVRQVRERAGAKGQPLEDERSCGWPRKERNGRKPSPELPKGTTTPLRREAGK
jgi:hypothetical protein